VPVGAYDSTRLSNIGIGHGAIDAGVGYTYLNPQTGHEFSGGCRRLTSHKKRSAIAVILFHDFTIARPRFSLPLILSTGARIFSVVSAGRSLPQSSSVSPSRLAAAAIAAVDQMRRLQWPCRRRSADKPRTDTLSSPPSLPAQARNRRAGGKPLLRLRSAQEFSLGAPLLLRRPPLRNKRASLILFLRAQVVRPKCLRPRSYNHYARPQIRRTVLWAIEARLPSAIRSSPSVASIITGGACSNASSSSGVKASSMRLARRS